MCDTMLFYGNFPDKLSGTRDTSLVRKGIWLKREAEEEEERGIVAKKAIRTTPPNWDWVLNILYNEPKMGDTNFCLSIMCVILMSQYRGVIILLLQKKKQDWKLFRRVYVLCSISELCSLIICFPWYLYITSITHVCVLFVEICASLCRCRFAQVCVQVFKSFT